MLNDVLETVYQKADAVIRKSEPVSAAFDSAPVGRKNAVLLAVGTVLTVSAFILSSAFGGYSEADCEQIRAGYEAVASAGVSVMNPEMEKAYQSCK